MYKIYYHDSRVCWYQCLAQVGVHVVSPRGCHDDAVHSKGLLDHLVQVGHLGEVLVKRLRSRIQHYPVHLVLEPAGSACCYMSVTSYRWLRDQQLVYSMCQYIVTKTQCFLTASYK